jgi:hypothetical protein
MFNFPGPPQAISTKQPPFSVGTKTAGTGDYFSSARTRKPALSRHLHICINLLEWKLFFLRQFQYLCRRHWRVNPGTGFARTTLQTKNAAETGFGYLRL